MITQKTTHNITDYNNYLSLLKSSQFLSPWCIINKELIIVEANSNISCVSKFDTIIGLHILQAFLSHILEEQVEQFFIAEKNNHTITVSIHEQEHSIEISKINNSSYILLIFMKQNKAIKNNKIHTEEIFIQNISHELRTPLTIILGYIEHLITNQDTHPFKEELSCIQQQGNRLHNTIDALTYLYFPKHFQQIPHSHENINTIINDFLNTQINKKDRYRISFIQSKDSIKVTIHTAFLHIILHNLINNALKFSLDDTNIIIKVTDTHNNFILSIQDKGIGIPQHLQEKIFERFYRVSNADNQSIQGLGIGLTITKKIIQAMKGNITLQSALKKGTTIILTFPKSHCTQSTF